MGRALRLGLIVPIFLLLIGLGSGHALARCFGVPEGPVEPGPGWRVHLNAEVEGYADDADFGVAEGASINFEPGLDAIENFSERKPFYLYFRYPFPDTKSNFFTVSIIRTADRLYWPLRLDVRESGPLAITISWPSEQVANISSEWALSLVGPSGERFDMRQVDAISLVVEEGVHVLRITASRDDAGSPTLEITVLALVAYGVALAVLLLLRRERKRRRVQPPR